MSRARPRSNMASWHRHFGRHHRGAQYVERSAQERFLQHDGRAQSRPVTCKCPMLVEFIRVLLFPALVAGFVVLAIACGLSPQMILAHMVTGLLVLAVGFALFSRGLVGGGDAKLAAAAAL